MSTLELEHLKHSSSSSNNLSVHSDGSLTLGNLQSLNVDSGTLYVDTTNNRVGIGTTTPLSKFHIDAANGAENFIRLHDGNSNYGYAVGLGSSGDYIISKYDGGSAVEALRIKRSNGVITMPYTPAFHVRLNDTGAQVQTPHTTHTVWENQGGHWNSTSHRFIAPVGGFYYFILNGYTNYTSGHGYIGIRKNGTQIHNGWHWNYTSTMHGMGGMTAGLTLQTNDYVDFTRPSAGASSKFDILNASGFLIG